ncbi:hypothetical protein SLS62_000047 [Diatrype stigma]|uniref:C2 NT-type domain-containing protein n=1 Tax=Diatrype stigma TaxID=117547 RepID=A0AAN9YXQ5_9PEZI
MLHRGRTAKCTMDKPSHRVTYNYSKIVPMRISIDRSNHLTDCPIEFEVLQELPSAPGAKDERITLGVVRLNLSEYVEESENFPRRGAAAAARAAAAAENAHEKSQNLGQGLGRRRLSSKSSVGGEGANLSPTRTKDPAQQQQAQQPHPEETDVVDEDAEEGIVRRYLMQDSKINSTLKVGILMVQVDGERNYAAPPLKTAPMFSGITGIMAGDAAGEPVDAAGAGSGGTSRALGAITSFGKSRDVSEVQDMYRRALAASWSCQPGELPADECIEDIFSGGDGWRRPPSDDLASASSSSGRHARRGGGGATTSSQTQSPHRQVDGVADDVESVHSNSNNSHTNSSSASPDDAARGGAGGGVGGGGAGSLRPTDVPRIMKRHGRRQSASSNHSDRSTRSGLTVISGESRDRDYRNHRPPLPEPSYTHSFSQLQQQQHNPSFHHQNLPLRNNGNNYQQLRPPSSRGGGWGRDDGSTPLPFPNMISSSSNHPHSHAGGDDDLHRSGSMASLAPTLGSTATSSSGRSSSDRDRDRHRGRRYGGVFRRQQEVDEHEIREDLIAWELPGTMAAT